MVDETRLRQRFEAVRGQLDERGLRLMAAAEARAAGYGGIAAVARAIGIARSTIGRGLADLDQPTWISRPGSAGLAAGPGPSCWQRAQARAGEGSDAPGGSAPPGRAGNAWRSNAAAAVGLQEPRQARGRTVCDGPPDQPEHGR